MQPIPIAKIKYNDCGFDILRLDLANQPVDGNKFYKLKYNLLEAVKTGKQTLLTFGGAFSNHIHAVAVAGKLSGLKTIGVIRGEDDPWNPTLQHARENGMLLHFVSRETYRKKYGDDFFEDLKNKFGAFYLLPEGGTNPLAVKGCTEILSGLENDYDIIFCATGTGGTQAGIISTPGLRSKVTGISVLKGDDLLTKRISGLSLSSNQNWDVNFNYHLGGYAKYNKNLVDFIRWFQQRYQIPLDPVYTGKLMYAVVDLINSKQIPSSFKILAIHTGGLQGIAGWEYRYGKII